MSLIFWLNGIMSLLGYGLYYPFMGNLENLLETRYDITNIIAGRLMSLPSFISLSAPLFGYLIMKYRRIPLFYFLCSLFAIICMTTFLILPTCEGTCTNLILIPLIFLGLFLTTYATTL